MNGWLDDVNEWIDWNIYRKAQSVVQKSDINAPGKSPNVPGKKMLSLNMPGSMPH